MSDVRRCLGRIVVAGAMIALAPVEGAAQAGGAPRWPEISRESRPWTRWWWLGSAIDSANITGELERLAAAGIGGVEVTSIYGVRGEEAAFVPYLSDRWVRLLAHASGEARRLGMGLDLPPGSGWRIGGPEVPPEDGSITLRIEADTVRGGESWTLDPAGRRIEAVTALSATGQRVRIGAPAAGAPLRWRAPAGVWTLFVAESRRNNEAVKRPAPGGEGRAVDVLSEAAVRRYLSAWRERFATPPGTVRSFFHDSYEYTGDGSSELFQRFRRLHGYDLADRLPELAGEGDPDLVARVKSDYRETMHRMVLESLVRQMDRWAEQQGSLSRNQAHGSPGNLLDLYAASDIPETEIFGPLTGTDADPLISKFASSAAHVAGKPLASAEAMTWLGEHFTVTLDQVKQAADQLFASGVNHIFYHGTAYSPDRAAWPGWLFYASTQFNPRNAFWRDIPALNRYVARTQAALQQGVPDSDVLLYWPVYDNWHDAAGRRMDFRVHDPKWFYEKPLGAVAQTLWRRGYGFDYVSDALLAEHLSAQMGRVVSAGGAAYRAVLVPATTHMPPATLERLLELAGGGATILFQDRLPTDVPGLNDLTARRRRLEGALRRVTLGAPSAGGVREGRIGRGRVLIAADVEALLAAAGVSRERMVDQAGVRFIRRRLPDGYQYFVTNAGPGRVEQWLPLASTGAAAALLDPMTGRAGFTPLRPSATGGVEAMVPLEAGESRLVRVYDAPTTGAAWEHAGPPAGPPVALRGSWDVQFLEGGPVLPPPFRADSLRSWTELAGPEGERFAGTARYTLRFDDPGLAARYRLELGRVAESARVRLNGQELGTLFARPFRMESVSLRPTGNVLEVEVTNLSANRIRDLDRRGVNWKIFHDINFVGIDYRPFDASGWPIRESGLLGPVTLQPLR